MALLSSQLTVFSLTVFAPLLEQSRDQVGAALVFADEGTPAFFRQGTTHEFAILHFPRDLRARLEFQLVAELFWYRDLSLC